MCQELGDSAPQVLSAVSPTGTCGCAPSSRPGAHGVCESRGPDTGICPPSLGSTSPPVPASWAVVAGWGGMGEGWPPPGPGRMSQCCRWASGLGLLLPGVVTLAVGVGQASMVTPPLCPVPFVSSHCPAQGTQQPAGLAKGSEVALPVATSQRDLVRRQAGRWRPGGRLLARAAACVWPRPSPARLRTLLGPHSGHGGTRRDPAPYTCARMYVPCAAPGDSTGPCDQGEQCLHRLEGSGAGQDGQGSPGSAGHPRVPVPGP